MCYHQRRQSCEGLQYQLRNVLNDTLISKNSNSLYNPLLPIRITIRYGIRKGNFITLHGLALIL